MKLKKLEINGFKSFPEKAAILFPPGISAVVGPNGCGKSNIVDALRWVMGEQSVKQLRGKAMEDVIFSGSNKKSPLNMAEVTLILKNDNGSAPEELREYSEIMLTRRLYRSGESAYLINKRPCRLKDIHNIFLGSGLGARSYAVIQQGNIGAIIDAGPEERRLFIEEAAGVTRFKRRKEEALRKVQSTKQNLFRITDIIAEVNRQMASLKRQARKAELYQKYQTQIRKLDVLIGLDKYDDFKHRIDETDVLLRDYQDTDLEHTSRIKRIDAAVEEVKVKRWQKNQEISDQKSRIFETQRNLDRTENDLTHYRQDIERLEDEIAKLKLAYTDLERKNRDIEAEIEQTEKQLAALQEEESHVVSLLDKEQAASRDIGNELAMLNRDLETGKSDLMDMVAQEARYKNIYQNITTNKDSLKRRLRRIDEEAAQAEKNADDRQGIFGRAQAHFDSFEDRIGDLTGRINKTGNQLDDKQQTLGKQVKRAQTLELDRNKARSQYTTLKKMEENFEWFKDGVKAIMTKSPSKADGAHDELERLKEDGLISIMADTIEPEPSFEIPVEAVLGESLQHILVKDQKTGLGLIHYLQSRNAGRSGFIPVSAVKPMAYAGQKKPDPSKLLLNHVSVKPGFEKIADVLLGHVIVADDINEAETIFNRNGALQTIVTKSGDIISHQGIMIGGSLDKISGILAKKQEIKQLGQEIRQLDRAFESARLAQRAMESEVRECESKLQQLIEEKGELLHDRTEAEKDLYKASEDLKHAKRHRDIVYLEQEQLIGEKSDLDEEMVRYNAAVSETADAVLSAQDKVTTLTEKIGALSLEMERFKEASVDFQLKLTALNARKENNTGTLKRLSAYGEDGLIRIEQISRDRVQKEQQQLASTQKIGEFEASLSTMYDDMKGLEQELESNEEIYQRIDAELSSNDDIISGLQTQREKNAQKVRLLEIETSEHNIKRDNIAARLEEQYYVAFSDLRIEFDQELEKLEKPMTEIEEELTTLRTKIARINDVNLGAIKEYDQLQTRYDFLCEQRDDLNGAIEDLHKVIQKINRITQERFLKTLASVNEKLKEVFPRLFEGGSAQLVLTQPDQPLETGVEFMIHPPGKKLTRMSLLSGGEKALSAIAFIFSIFLIKPASFCLMDEIDAPLDDANISRFNNLLQMIGEKYQIIMITHNKKTMEFADKLFGITMIDKGISKIVSVNLNQPEKAEEPMVS